MPNDTCSIFISHASVDEEIALSLKQYLGKAFPGNNIFSQVIPRIFAQVTIGCRRYWPRWRLRRSYWFWRLTEVWTKNGFGSKLAALGFPASRWFLAALAKLAKGILLRHFPDAWASTLTKCQTSKVLFERLEGMFGKPSSNTDFDTVAKDMIRLDVRADERQKIIQDPSATEKINTIERRMKNLSPAEQETIRLFAVYCELSTAGVKTLVKHSGVDMNRWSVPQHLVGVTGKSADPAPGNKPYDDMQMNVYTINHEIRPFLLAYFSSVNNHN